ncbi:hypothetical protein [Amycolatopsis sp. NPDC058986]|uniref:hypothetical protein n=1 Tax=unclassified Amycolatopsis TaxID=2618356 RepID=UPI003671A896
MNAARKPSSNDESESKSSDDESVRVARTLYLDEDLVESARAAAHYLGAYVPEANIRSLSDIFEPGARKLITQLQNKYNEGKPFPRVSNLRRGRPSR